MIMLESVHPFFVWNHHFRFLESGEKLAPRKNESLIITRVEYWYHKNQKSGRIFYGDGTFTQWFPINEENPSDLAITARNFSQWYIANSARLPQQQGA